MNINSSKNISRNENSKEINGEKSLDRYLKKFYSKKKEMFGNSKSLDSSKLKLNSARIDESMGAKLDELSNLSKLFAEKMKIVDANKIKEIDTAEKWEKLNFKSSSVIKAIGSKKNKRNLKFSFADYQREFEKNWLNSLKGINNDRQLKMAVDLMNGGYNDKDIKNCPYILDNEVRKLEEKASSKNFSRIRKKLEKGIVNFTRRSIIKDLEDKNSKIEDYCDCKTSHKLTPRCPKDYKSIIVRSRPISAEKLVRNLREKLKISNSSKSPFILLEEDNTSKFEEISFLNTARDWNMSAIHHKEKEKYPLPSVTRLENLYRTKWNRIKSLNPTDLHSVTRRKRKSLDEIIKGDEKSRLKYMVRRIGYQSNTMLNP